MLSKFVLHNVLLFLDDLYFYKYVFRIIILIATWYYMSHALLLKMELPGNNPYKITWGEYNVYVLFYASKQW
jgi:hypothetical protein